jgi:hypothetical protein
MLKLSSFFEAQCSLPTSQNSGRRLTLICADFSFYLRKSARILRGSGQVCVPLLIAALALALMVFTPLAGLTAYGLESSPVGALSSQHGGSAPCAVLQNPTVRIDPAESVVGPRKSFTVAVMIDQASNLGGFEFTLWFTPTTVTVGSVTLGDFLGSTGRTVIPVGPTINNQTGRASFGAASVGSAAGPDGTGSLATITLTAQDGGESPLDLQGVMVLDTHAQHQTTTVQDGTVRVASLYLIHLPLVLKAW